MTFRNLFLARTGSTRRAVLVGALACAAVVLFWVILPAGLRIPESSDYESFYEPVARSLLAGRGVVLPGGDLATRYPPGHPVAIAMALAFSKCCGVGEVWALRGLILVSFGATAAMLYLFAAGVWGPHAGLVAPALYATYPFALWLTKEPLSEVTFTPILVAAVWVLWNALRCHDGSLWRFPLAGILAGLAMLVRPAAIGLPLVMGCLVFALPQLGRFRRRTLLTLMMVGGTIAVVNPWEVFVYLKTGRVIPLSTGGPSSLFDGVTFAVRDKYYREKTPVPDAIARFMERVNQEYPPGADKTGVLRTVVQEARVTPLGAVGLTVWKAARAWYATDSQRRDRLAAVVQVPYILLLSMAMIRAIRIPGPSRLLAIVTLSTLVYFWAVTITVLSIVRYMVPAIVVGFVVTPVVFVRPPALDVRDLRSGASL